MNAPKPIKSLAGKTCPRCREGKFELRQIDHLEKVAEDNPLLVPGIWVDRCSNCAQTLFPADTVHYIENFVAEEKEKLSPRELEDIRERLGVDRQDEMSEILGLGGKTYHRWENGTQFPTRSMCYYIRMLAEFPEAFDWLRNRAWRHKNRTRITGSIEQMFPDFAKAGGSLINTGRNAACGLRGAIHR